MTGSDVVTLVDSWPKAIVAVTLILAVLVMPSLLSYLAARQAKRSAVTVGKAHETLTTTNGGSTVKDQLNRIEDTLGALDGRMTAVETVVNAPVTSGRHAAQPVNDGSAEAGAAG